MAADLRQGEHIPKLQNDIGRKSTLRVLRQLRSNDGGGEVPWRAGPWRAALGPALDSCRKFTLDRSNAGMAKTPGWARTYFLRFCNLLLYQLRHTYLININYLDTKFTILYSVLYCITILYYSILYYTVLYYTIVYYTILYYTILYCSVRSA